MPLPSILTITKALLNGSGGRLAEGSAAAEDALLPFAAVLSGTLSLLSPEQATPEADAAHHLVPEEGTAETEVSETEASQTEASQTEASQTEASDALLPHTGLVTLDPSDLTGPSSKPAPSSTLLPAVDEGLEGIRPGTMPTSAAESQGQTLEAAALQTHATATDRAGTHDAAPQALANETAPPASAPPVAQGEGAEPSSETAGRLLHTDEQIADPVLDPSKEEGAEVAEAAEKASARRRTARTSTPHDMGKKGDVGKKTASVAQTTEQAAQPVVAESKETPATAMTPTEAASVAPEGDTALPDLDAAKPEKTTEASGPSRDKATATDIDGGGVSADAGGDSESKKDGTRRMRRARRAEAEPAALRKIEQSAVEQARAQETAAPQPHMPIETTPELPDPETAALPDLDSSLAPAEEHVAPSASNKSTADAPTGRARAARGLFQQNRAVPVAWLRAVLNNARQDVFSKDGWKVLEMNLDEGDGTVTIKARREEGRVAVAVGFSDPELRALASTHAERLQEALQAQYETAVDFSLFSGDTGDSGAHGRHEGSGPAVAAATHADADTPDGYPARRTLPAGTLHEWVG